MGFSTATSNTQPECLHWNGWFMTATFWIFKKRYFVCTDCGRATAVEQLNGGKGNE